MSYSSNCDEYIRALEQLQAEVRQLRVANSYLKKKIDEKDLELRKRPKGFGQAVADHIGRQRLYEGE